MRSLITILIYIGIASTGVGQKIKEDLVPGTVRTAFAKIYPDVKKAKWEKEGDAYEASFELNKKEVSALFDGAGNVKDVETEIEKNTLPLAVKNSLSKDYADCKVKAAAKILSENLVTYEAEVTKGKESFDLIFSAEGKLLKKVEWKNEKH